MELKLLPILLFAVCAAGLALVMLFAGSLFGPKRNSAVKRMPYESGMDPIHDAHKKFDVRFHLVAIAFLIFDVELLFLYPWAVSSRSEYGIDAAIRTAANYGVVLSRGLIFAEAMVFIALLAVGLAYAWRKGVFQWR